MIPSPDWSTFYLGAAFGGFFGSLTMDFLRFVSRVLFGSVRLYFRWRRIRKAQERKRAMNWAKFKPENWHG